MTKHVITVSDGDIVELVPQQSDSSTTEDTAGFAAQAQVLPGAPADAGRRLGVIISCPPLPQPPVMLQSEDVHGFYMRLGEDGDYNTGNVGGGGSSTGYAAGVATGVALAILFL